MSDADNFCFYHTPGVWKAVLKGKTIHIRMVGMHGRHFGRPVQPYYVESFAWLKDNIEGGRVKYELLRRGQYERIIALPLLPHTFWPWHHYRWW